MYRNCKFYDYLGRGSYARADGCGTTWYNIHDSDGALFLLSTPAHWSDKLSTYSNDHKEGSTKIVNFMTPGAEVLQLGRGHIKWQGIISLKSSSLLPRIDQINLVYSNDEQGGIYENCKFHDL